MLSILNRQVVSGFNPTLYKQTIRQTRQLTNSLTKRDSGKIQTTDHLVTCKLIAPESREWRTDMWVAVFDFQKPFDDAIWRSLRNQSFYQIAIHLSFEKLHADQRAAVLTDVESEIASGAKKGDPLSSLLFNSVQGGMEKDIGTWNEKGFGIKL